VLETFFSICDAFIEADIWHFETTLHLDLTTRKILMKRYIWSVALQGAENRTFQKVYQKYLDSSEERSWRRIEKIIRSDRVKNGKKYIYIYCAESRKKRTSYIEYSERRLIRLVSSCVETAFQDTLLKERQKGREDEEEEDVSSCWVTLRKKEHTDKKFTFFVRLN
jgi:hypothetical protein